MRNTRTSLPDRSRPSSPAITFPPGPRRRAAASRSQILPSARGTCHHDECIGAGTNRESTAPTPPALPGRTPVTLSCHVLSYEILSGPVNMALDEALLDRVACQPDAACLRTYGWSDPTLSLGYFQSLRQATAEARWRSVPTVRRATGGGAIWHHHEVTYAVVLPAHHRLARPSTALYRTVHAAIVDVLRAQGLHALRRAGSQPAPAQPADAASRPPFLCFTDRDPEDIVADGFKVVGSAEAPGRRDPPARIDPAPAVRADARVTGCLRPGRRPPGPAILVRPD